MEIKNGVVILGEARGVEGLSRHAEYMSFDETSGTRVLIPIKTLLRLHSILQYEVERQDTNFEEYCQSFFVEN